jgi:hypothetical protein
MRYLRATGALVCAGVALCVQQPAARAQELQNPRIEITYEEPKQGVHRAIYDRLKQRQVLEQLKQFMAPLRLPKKLAIQTVECGEVNAYYNKVKGLLLCYEYLADLEKRIASEQPPAGYNRADALVGGFLGVTFHEVGHALFDILEIPVYGREEDAADQMAGFILLQFGSEVSRRMISGTAYMWLSKDKTWPRTLFSDEHGNDLQRHYNFLCLGYGGDPKTFQDFVDKGALPADRAKNCAREYQQVKNAFVKTVLPYIDQNMMKTVQSKQWLRPEDFR